MSASRLPGFSSATGVGHMIAVASSTFLYSTRLCYIGVTIFALVRSCRRVDRLETTRLLSATGSRTFDRGRERHVRLRTQGACWLLLLESNMIAYCSYTMRTLVVTIFALCTVLMLQHRATAVQPPMRRYSIGPCSCQRSRFWSSPIGCWASTVARLQEARRHSQGLA